MRSDPFEPSENLIKTLLLEAYEQAVKSPDPSNQCGAIVYRRNLFMTVGRGHNNFQGLEPVFEPREAKLARIQHAERAALFDAWGSPGPLWLAAPWAACCHCAQDIISCKRVTRLIVHKQRQEKTPERWKQSIDFALKDIRDSGITIHEFDGKIGGVEIIVNGERWQP